MNASDPQARRQNAAGERDSRLAMRELAGSLPLALLSTRESVMNRFRPLLRAHLLTEQQWRVIRTLVEQSPLQVTELAERSFILAPSLSRILQNLERRDLVAREVLPSDRRRMTIAITTQGQALFNTIAPASEAQYGRIAEAFGGERMHALFVLLEELRLALDDHSPRP